MDQRLLELGRSQFVELLDLCRRRRDEIGAWYRQEVIGARDDSRTGEEYVAVFAGLGLGEPAHVVDGLGLKGCFDSTTTPIWLSDPVTASRASIWRTAVECGSSHLIGSG